jgi:hypothetical protein
MEGLAGQVHQRLRVLADAVEHHRPGELGRHLADDVDALRLQIAQVVHRAAPRCSSRLAK